MSLGFTFTPPVDPYNPLDPSDPPPEGWDTNIDTRDYRKALFGFRSDLFAACCEWEKREKERHEDSKDSTYVFRFRKPLKDFAKSLGEHGYVDPCVKFFRDRPRAEIWTNTKFGFSALIALVRVEGEMGCPSDVMIISPVLLPDPAKESFTKALSELTVRFELCSLRNMKE